MEKINTEVLISSLIVVGFDKVDSLLYTYVLGQLSIDNQQMQMIEFEDSEFHQIFNQYIEFNGAYYKLKDGITLDTMVSYNNQIFYPLRMMLNTNKKLINYLIELDYRNIINRKIESLGINSLLFIDKEKDIIYAMYDQELEKKDSVVKGLRM